MNGFNPQLEREAQDGTEWIFGAADLRCLAEGIPENERSWYLPIGEIQRGVEDMSDCASRGPVNLLEAKFNWLMDKLILSFENDLWLRQNGYIDNGIKFSDAFVSINSGTTKQGNSMKAPIDAIRKHGLIPKRMLPLEPNMTWEDYHNPERITADMRDLGKEFLKRFSINYEKVYEKDFETLLHKDLLNVAGYAWPEPVNGEYPRTDNDPNHVFVAFKTPKYWIYDNYLDSVDGNFDKKLASDYDLLDYAYRLLVNQEAVKPKKKCFIIKWLGEIFT